MFYLYIILAALALYLVLNFLALARVSVPLAPPMTPGDLGEARDPEYFARQAAIFAEHDFEPAGDFLWHYGLATTAMRVFIAKDRAAFAWIYEDSMAGSAEIVRAASILTEFTDGTVISTTSSRRATLAPPWFIREAAGPGTGDLLGRHAERLVELAAAGREPLPVRREAIVETIRRIERGLGEYQVKTGRYRLAGDRLRYTAWGIIWTIGSGLARIAAGLLKRR